MSEAEEKEKRFRHAGTLVTLSCIIFLFYLAQAQFRPTLPRYIESNGGGEAEVGFIIFLNWAAQAAFSVPLGAFSDRVGKRAVIMLGGVIAAVGFAVLPAMSTVLLILLAYAAAGVGQAGYSAATAAYSVDLSRREHTARAIAWTQAARQSALSFGPALGGILAVLLGVGNVFISSALLVLAGVLFSWFLLKDLPQTSKGLQKEDGGGGSGWLILRKPLILASLIGIFSLQFGNSVFVSFTPLYANQLSVAVIGVIFTVQGIVNAVGRPIIGELSDRIRNPKPVILLSMLAGAAGLFLLSFSAEFELLILVALLIGLSTGIGVVLFLTIIVEQVPKQNQGFTMGFFNMSLYLGLGIGPAVEGLVIENSGYLTAFRSAGLIPLAGAIIFFVLSNKEKKQERVNSG
ncbi:MAG: MFS transporter [Thaumarchaeota archaeon]|nr:MFS transporter [Nitrososphaerota archaeon]